MTSTGPHINLFKILNSLDKESKNNILNKTESTSNNNHHHNHHHRHQHPKPESKVELSLEFPIVVSLVRSRLDSKSRTLLENSKQLLSSPPPSSSSSSCLYDTGALLMILNHLNPIQNPNQNPANHHHHQHHFVIKNVEHVDLLFGEEMYLKLSDGSLSSTGRRLEIPKNFEGWFEILSQDGRSSQQITDVTSLVKRNTKHFLITKPTKALTIQRNTESPVSTSLNDYKQTTISVGHELHWFQLVTLCNGLQYLSCRLKHSKRQEQGNRDVDESGDRETVVLLPLTGQGRFLPVSRDSNLTDAHDAQFLISKLHMPLVVRLYWPPTGRNIPYPSIRCGSNKIKDMRKMGFFQRRSISSPRIEPASYGSPSFGEFMTSTIVRMHGHARQKVLYMAPMIFHHETGSSASAGDLQGELKVVALRGQACKFFDVAIETKLKVKADVLESLKKKKQLVQSAFEKEVKIFDTTLYKMTGEKLTVNKQPISVAKENEVTDRVQPLDGVIFRPDERNHKESVAKRRSLPLDVTLEMRDGGFVRAREEDGYDKIGEYKDDDESLLMNEIENIYMRVRYWDRSVRYPFPQKNVSQQHVAQQIPQHKQQIQRISTKPKQNDPSQQQQKTKKIFSQDVETTKTEQLEPPVPPRNHQQHQQQQQQQHQQQQHQQQQQQQQQKLPTPPLPQLRTTPLTTSDLPPIDNKIDNIVQIADEIANPIETKTTTTTTSRTTTPAGASTSVNNININNNNSINPMATATTTTNRDENSKDIKGAVKNAFKNLVKKNKGSMDVAKLAGNEFSYFRVKQTKP